MKIPNPPKRSGKTIGQICKATASGHYKWLESGCWVWIPVPAESRNKDPKEFMRLHTGRKNRKMSRGGRKLF